MGGFIDKMLGLLPLEEYPCDSGAGTAGVVLRTPNFVSYRDDQSQELFNESGDRTAVQFFA